MKRRHGLYTVVTALFLILATGSNAVRADIPSWFWGSLFNWADGVTAEVDVVDARVAVLEAQVAAIPALQAQVAAMDAYIQKLQAYVEVDETTNPTRPTVRVVSANLQVVSGGGATNAAVNGLGNIIVGYDELNNGYAAFVCSSGFFLDQTSCEAQGEVWASDHKTGSHNLIVGGGHRYSRSGGFVAGEYNIINGRSASVSGGVANMAGNTYSSVTGGSLNRATEFFSVVSGGENNTASGLYSAVSGGDRNTASLSYSVVSGGQQNIASGTRSVVSGGIRNESSARWATVSGGADRESDGEADWRAGTLFQNF